MQRAHLFVVPVVMNSAARRLEHEPEGLHRGYQRRPTGAGGPSRSYPDAMATPRSTSSTARRLRLATVAARRACRRVLRRPR